MVVWLYDPAVYFIGSSPGVKRAHNDDGPLLGHPLSDVLELV